MDDKCKHCDKHVNNVCDDNYNANHSKWQCPYCGEWNLAENEELIYTTADKDNELHAVDFNGLIFTDCYKIEKKLKNDKKLYIYKVIGRPCVTSLN